MLWSGYDTLLLQQVPVMQATSGLGRWRLLELFTEAFARAWEEEAKILLGDSQRYVVGRDAASLTRLKKLQARFRNNDKLQCIY